MSLFNENFYTDDFDQEMIDYVRNLGSISKRSGVDYLETKYKYLKYGSSCDYFWTNNITITLDEYNYLTKQQFREKVGMTQKQFTKADLKDGMVVKYRGSSNGLSLANSQKGLRLMVAGFAISEDSFNEIDAYSDELIYAPQKSFNIDEVFNVVSLCGGLQNIENWKLKSIWKRPEPVEAPPVPSPEQIEIASIQAEIDKLSQRLSELKGKV